MTLWSRTARFIVIGALAAIPSAAVVAPALACGNSYRYELDPKTNLVVKAEEALSEGEYAQAWRLAENATGKMGQTVEGKDSPGDLAALRARSLRVGSIAAIRAKGQVKLAGHLKTPRKTDSGDDGALVTAWAVDQLRVLTQREAGNPYLQARLAEGLALGPAGETEALAILGKLVADDLMPDAQAWLLYAQLQKEPKERDRGLEQCKLRASDPTICKIKGPGET